MAPETFPRGMKTISQFQQFFEIAKINRFQFQVGKQLFDYIRLASGPCCFILIEDEDKGTIFKIDTLIPIVFEFYLKGADIQYL
jgi:hypothetical protein